MDKVGCFVDLSNIHYCVTKKFPGLRVDYIRYKNYAAAFGDPIVLMAYGVQEGDAAKDFITFLKRNDYEPKFIDRTGEKRFINWSAGITIDIVRTIDEYDTVVLGTTDPDMIPVMEWCKDQNKKVVVIAALVNKQVKAACDQFVEITKDFIDEANEAE